MPRLSLSLLGSYQATLDGAPVTAFESNKVRALLAYLVMEADQPHRRQTLVGLLWPAKTEAAARTNLRRALTNLRQTIGDCHATLPFLLITHETIQFNPGSDYCLDVGDFTQLLTGLSWPMAHLGMPALEPQAQVQSRSRPDLSSSDIVNRLEQAMNLYRGGFLEGFSLRDSPAFDDWALLTREWLQRQALAALYQLATWYEERGEYERACHCAWRQLELEPWQEEAHQQLMRLLALSGRRGAALAQYETCRRRLVEELGIEPGPETTVLYEQIRSGELGAKGEVFAPVPPGLPPFVAATPPRCPSAPFVAREGELERLDGFLYRALAGQGQVVFVTGGPGRGKTALIQAFARRALEAHPDLLVATGNGDAYTGLGDPYLPFREMLGLLTGDIQARWAAGAIGREQAVRLWNALPRSAQALIDDGPDLVGTLVPGPALVTRATACAPGGGDWLVRLKELVHRHAAGPGPTSLLQGDLFEQYTRVLHSLARQKALLLAVDDLQWADAGSISLLFHVGKRLAGARILLVGAYRPGELARGQDGERHLLESVVNEFKREWGDIELNLAQAAGRVFIDAFLDAEPNRLGVRFRETLYHQTSGHPLFTIELLRSMRERGDVIQDAAGFWVEGPALDWERLPARVEAVIAERFGRLPANWQALLGVASVEGEEFVAEVVASVSGVDEEEVIGHLSGPLSKQHRLVVPQSLQRLNGRSLSRYRFRHYLFQKYLYRRLDEVERVRLHEVVGRDLETLYGERADEIAVQLARHFETAGLTAKAVDYLLKAGDQARSLYAYQEATEFYQRALALLKDQGAYARAARTLMKLGLTYHTACNFQLARQAYREGFALLQRAGEIHPETSPPPAPHALRLTWPDPLTLDPTMAGDLSSDAVINQLFSGLVELGTKMEVIPDVAQSWDVSEGGHLYVFHLRDDVRWSDGTSVTADDFEYAWKRVLDPINGSPSAHLFFDIKGAEAFNRGEAERGEVGVGALDELTLAVELEGPAGYFLHLLTNTATYPVPRHVVEAHGEGWADMGNIVTNGPFRLDAWRPGQSMVFSRNQKYHGRFAGNVERVELDLSLDPSARLEMYEAGDLDVVEFWGLRPSERRLIWERHFGDYISVPRFITFYVGFDASRPPFNDSRVRQAFAMAADREKLAHVVMHGYVSPATGGFIPPGMPGHSAEIGLPYDPNRARQLLSESGYRVDRDFPTVGLVTHEGYVPLCEPLQAQWRENLGVDLMWETMDPGMFFQRLDVEPPQIFLLGWDADYPDPDDFLRGSSVRQYTGWRDQAYDMLVEKARRTLKHTERIKLYQEADRILVSQAAIVPFFYMRWHLFVKPWVRKYPVSPIRVWLWKEVIIEPH